MLPPLLLRVERGQQDLDICSAPGSKTVLLLHFLRGGNDAAVDGVVVANDADFSRCRKMRLRLAPMRSPALLLTCHLAQNFPGESGSFDRVLCDVPCSGDGTMRKNPTVWEKWKPVNSCRMHALQLSILQRGLQLLRPGGLLLYSTCSFSPVCRHT